MMRFPVQMKMWLVDWYLSATRHSCSTFIRSLPCGMLLKVVRYVDSKCHQMAWTERQEHSITASILIQITIAKKYGSAAEPSFKDFLLQHDLGDQVLGCSVNHIAHGQDLSFFASWHFEMSDLLAHGLGRFGAPLGVAERVVFFGRVLVQELKNHPTNAVFGRSKSNPLSSQTHSLRLSVFNTYHSWICDSSNRQLLHTEYMLLVPWTVRN